ncbi:bifunctional proline dehydrogenase/L-glutamate gamma-semialdehyde dehydrogenase PutA [Pseudooceanicola sp. C21-150M6]|uniref:bifunctional proline dehydrogenase/L-glutamate gamma-semialdehyde dehydrogenase PutA n=1 Tax=Pseudooceanicola sp. C21-150M6 TaxID=3434355 RepID=UPI003D7FF712
MIDFDLRWDRDKFRNEAQLLAELTAQAGLDDAARAEISANAAGMVRAIRKEAKTGITEAFLVEYGLSTEEGLALMRLAEALLRVPDLGTMEALIEDKITPADWGKHAGHSSSSLVNVSTRGLQLTRSLLAPKDDLTVRGVLKRVSEPVIRRAVVQAMREMGRQYVLGETIAGAMRRAARQEARGYTYSYDMLGEAAMTAEDAELYASAYSRAITAIAAACTHGDIGRNPGISVKLSALHPRYEVAQKDRVMAELVASLSRLCRQAAKAGMGLNIDAEESERLALSLEVIEKVLEDPELGDWQGFGVVVQAYGRRAGHVIDSIYEMAGRSGRRIMVRLVKGAYWDGEIKKAQTEGLEDFPVFTRKAASDVSYIGNARRLMRMADRLYPQFATHNAHTVSAILKMAAMEGLSTDQYEFQRLHGMGEVLHDKVRRDHGTRCRIYAPVGAHRDLLAYLVRRLLENGANSSFVNQIADTSVPAEDVTACPFAELSTPVSPDEPEVVPPAAMFGAGRVNSKGFDLSDQILLKELSEQKSWAVDVAPITRGDISTPVARPVTNPATGAVIGQVAEATAEDVAQALDAARPWDVAPAERARVLRAAADLYEQDHQEIFGLLTAEAGKTLRDGVAELREAVDFLRYYAGQAEALDGEARGLFTCISPWNFPLAIFTGQIAAALAAGNGVLAKPAESTPAIAAWGVARLLQAGVPASALQLLPGAGSEIGAQLTSDPRIGGVAFTGSTATARRIQASMAESLAPGTPLIAETGGLNAMIVDSTALPEQAVRDIVISAFQSAGQRCSALRCLYVQEHVADRIEGMIIGAMNELRLGDPALLTTDVGPVITAEAKAKIDAHVAAAQASGQLIHQIAAPSGGHFVGPALIRVSGIADLKEEIFGPVLHIATYKAGTIPEVVREVNATGYGLTFGLHTRIDRRVEEVAASVHAGNVYVNRNQIGAIVGSQPFGGEGLSGTGPKAGGPNYVPRFRVVRAEQAVGASVSAPDLTALMSGVSLTSAPVTATDLPGPTGEVNRLMTFARPPVLCLGPGAEVAAAQVQAIEAMGGVAVAAEGLEPEALEQADAIGGVIWWGAADRGRDLSKALARRAGPIVPLICDRPDTAHAVMERHVCIDTTAAGGNATLLAGGAG